MFQGHCHSRWRIGWLRRSNKYTLADDGDSFTFAIWKIRRKVAEKVETKTSRVILWNIFKFCPPLPGASRISNGCRTEGCRFFFRLATAERDPSFKPGGPVFFFGQGPSTAPLWDCRRWVILRFDLMGYLSVIPSLKIMNMEDVFFTKGMFYVAFQYIFPKTIWRWTNWLKWKYQKYWFSQAASTTHSKATGSEASIMELPRAFNVGALVTGAPFFFMKRRMDLGGKRCWNGETFGCKSCDHKSYYHNHNDFVFGHYHELGFIVFLCWCLVFAEFVGCIKIFFLHEVGWRGK